MDILLYEKPIRIELIDYELFIDGKKHERKSRTLGQMSSVLMEPRSIASMEGQNLYFMYRQVFKQHNLRFDITVIPAASGGTEFPKTFGHYHPPSGQESEGKGHEYPEVYQVLKGKATFILQKKNHDETIDAVILDATERDVILLPPNYGHVSINSGKEDLVLSNIVYDEFISTYDEYKDNHGAAYYYLRDGELVQNDSYIVKGMERLSAKDFNGRFKFTCKDLLHELYAEPKKFEFLHKPGLLFKA